MNPRTLFLIRRLILMVSGEALQSGFHFALNLYLLHILSAADYGIFAISMVMGGVAIAYTRSLTAVPASVWISRSRTRREADAYDITFGSGALLLSTTLALLAMALLWLWESHGPVIGGLFIGLWALRSHLRTASFARHRQWIVSCSDLTFTFIGCAVTAFIVYQGRDVLVGIFQGLAVANGLGILLLLFLPRTHIRISFRREVRRRYMRLWPQLRWTVFYVSTALLQGQTIAILVTSVAGPAAYAPIAAVMTLFAPLRIIATAFDNMMQPEMSAAMGRHDYARVWKQALLWSGILGLGCLVYGALVFLIVPYIKSETFADASIHVIGASAMVISTLLIVYSMPRIILETAGSFSTLALFSGLAALVGLVSIAILLAISTPAWALAGAALAEVTFFSLCWAAVYRRLKGGAGLSTAGQAK
ncbi:polysaccharide biosynthesis protein [Affinirhizobium pseudoryzae]|uniref:hypothetical protein n=1 Tax=Allorhizobium pseudoryzae TaxID=379684 RepID=UPI0013ED280C|nr:hypothetical protein [Allorhizobium pseudoryzae]